MKNKLKGCFENLEGRCGNQGREIRKKERKKKDHWCLRVVFTTYDV